MNKDYKMANELFEIYKEMKVKQEQEPHIVKQTEENTWAIINENGEVVNTITKNDIVNYCKIECENNDTCCFSADIMTDSIWWYIHDEYDLEFVDNYCQEWDKFTAWFDYICIEYLAQEIVAIYKQKLLDFE